MLSPESMAVKEEKTEIRSVHLYPFLNCNATAVGKTTRLDTTKDPMILLDTAIVRAKSKSWAKVSPLTLIPETLLSLSEYKEAKIWPWKRK